jgi:hypothetical protein
MSRRLLTYEIPDEMLAYLIAASVDGPAERQLAAKLLLECLRRFHTKEQIEACLQEVGRTSILDVVPEAKRLASRVGLLSEDGA